MLRDNDRVKHYVIGPAPPPLGGVSVFVDRFTRQLRRDGRNVELVDFSGSSKRSKWLRLLKLAFAPRPAYFQCNTLDFSVMAALLIRPFPANIVFIDHGNRNLHQMSRVRKALLRRFLDRVDELRLVGDSIWRYYETHQLLADSRKTVIQNSFLPPPTEDEPRIWKTYPPEVIEFVEQHRPLIVANAFRIVLENGVDLYGLDMCIELLAALAKQHPRVGLLFALAEVGNAEYLAKMQRRAAELGVSDRLYFMTGQRELWPLFRRAQLMVRPTAYDGYGISVAEAIYLGCPAIASDVCRRYEGTRIFKSRDGRDFYDKCSEALQTCR